jgi:hypothetical protein
MPTLEELMAEVMGTPSQEQTKVASAKSASTEEIDRVLEGLGLSDVEAVKTASETLNDNGGNMSGSLTELLYGELLGETKEETAPAPEATTEKVASAEGEVEAVTGLEVFGEATGHYFNAAMDSYVEKVAGDLMAESHGMMDPNPPHASAIAKSLGANGSPNVHSNLQKGDLKVSMKNHGSYDNALKSLNGAVLKRISNVGQIGNVK